MDGQPKRAARVRLLAAEAVNKNDPNDARSGRPSPRCGPGHGANRKLNHAAHITAVTQARHKHSEGRAYYDKKLAQGKTAKEALRALKRQVSDAFYQHLKADATPDSSA